MQPHQQRRARHQNARQVGSLVRAVWLLRPNARLAQARVDEAPYHELRDRYREIATSPGFEGHMQWAEAMPGRRSDRTQSKMMNLLISNVPGPRERGNTGGATVSEIYSVGPLLAGSGMNITVWSYVDQLNISVLTDDVTLDDPHEATDAIVQAFIELRTAAGLPVELTEVLTAMAPASAD
jgi:hypothetical protein